MSKEKDKAAYDALNHKSVKERMSQIMLAMIKSKDLSGEADEIYHQVKENFTEDELAYMSCCYIGLEFKKALENPTFLMLTKILKMLYDNTENVDKSKEDELMKEVMNILKN